jgi:hypothetical protein
VSESRTLNIIPVLLLAWRRGFSVKSDFARANAEAVAACACLGLITTQSHPSQSQFARTWLITADGLRYLRRHP